MALVTLREVLDYAASQDFGLPAFNVSNLEQVRAVFEAANQTGSPAILQGSSSGVKYAGPQVFVDMINAVGREFRGVHYVLHQDHGHTWETCLRSLRLGFTSVMMDGSLLANGKTPASYEHNVEITSRVVEMAHACGVSVEGELGCLGALATGQAGEEDGSGAEGILTKEQMLTDPNQALDFVKKTKVDALAIAIGTSHGAYKFSAPPTGDVLVMDRIAEIHQKLPNTHLVMHGSSSVPQEWLKIINDHGGNMGETYGVPVEEIVIGIKNGVRKINIDTDLRMAMTGAVRQQLAKDASDFDPRKFFGAAKKAMTEICVARFEAFGCAGKVGGLNPRSIFVMQDRYAKGDLA
jgi:fructose-bisphosphate aldolase class II